MATESLDGAETERSGKSALPAGRMAMHLALAVLVLGAFAVHVEELRFLSDDGFIAFRYARNLVDGLGPVFNPGERVEGYTQPVWILLMALGMELGVHPEVFSQVLGIAAGLGILAGLLRLTCLVAPRAGAWMWVAPASLAMNRSFCGWCTGGLGTQLFALLVLASLVRFVREWQEPRRGSLGSSALFALTTLARPEGGLFALVAGVFLLVDVGVRRRRGPRELFAFALPFALVVGAHFLWRRQYYGEWLPNTFYAKVSGFWWEQSRVYLGLFARDHLLLLCAPLLLVLTRRGDLATALLAGATVIYVAYIVYIGGDRFEYRFMTPILPPLYWLLQESARRLCGTLDGTRWSRVARPLGPLLAGLVVATAAYPTQRGFEYRDHITSLENIEGYARLRSTEGRFLRRLVDERYLRGDELIALRGIGALPYYSGLPTLDLHGLADAEVARAPVTKRGIVSHEKLATRAYVRERGVVLCNVVNQVVFDGSEPNFAAFMDPGLQSFAPYFPAPVRCVRALDRYLLFGTTLSEEEFRETFARFEILR